MIAANRFTVTYARALLAATPREQLADPGKPKVIRGNTAETLARMEREMEHLQRDYRLVEDGYGNAMLNLVIAKGYVSRLLANEAVRLYLDRHHRELSEELRNVIASVAREPLSRALRQYQCDPSLHGMLEAIAEAADRCDGEASAAAEEALVKSAN